MINTVNTKNWKNNVIKNKKQQMKMLPKYLKFKIRLHCFFNKFKILLSVKEVNKIICVKLFYNKVDLVFHPR